MVIETTVLAFEVCSEIWILAIATVTDLGNFEQRSALSAAAMAMTITTTTTTMAFPQLRRSWVLLYENRAFR